MNNIKSNNTKIFCFILLCYVCANGLMLLQNGPVWDDWGLVFNIDSWLEGNYVTKGLHHLYYYNKFLLNISTLPIFYKLIVFIAGFITVYFFGKSLDLLKISWLTKFEKVLCMVFVATIPFMMAKNAMNGSSYIISVTLFTIGFYCYLKYYLQKKNIYIIFSLFFLGFSFFTNSLLVFYLCSFLISTFYIDNRESRITLKTFIQWVALKAKKISFLVFLLYPFVFFALQKYFAPKGLSYNQDYNEIKLIYILNLPYSILVNIKDNILGLFVQFVVFPDVLFFFIILSIIAVILSLFLIKRNKIRFNTLFSYEGSRMSFILGLVLFVFGALAYDIVGKLPTFEDMMTRHQLLLSFGTAFIFISLIKQIKSLNIKWWLSLFLLTFFISISIVLTKNYLVYWMKNESITQNLIGNKKIQEQNTFIVYDEATDYNSAYKSMGHRFDEFNSYAYIAYGTRDRFFITESYLEKLKVKNLTFMEDYYKRKQSGMDGIAGAEDYIPDSTKYACIYVKKNESKNLNLRSNTQLARLLYVYYFQNEKFDNIIKDYIILEVVNCHDTYMDIF